MTERSTRMEGLTLERGYTTKDFTALRAYVQRIPPAAIARTYYDPDEDRTPRLPARWSGTCPNARHAGATRARAWLDHAGRAPACVDQAARPTEVDGSDLPDGDRSRRSWRRAPHPDHAIGAWLRPRVARRLKGEGITTLGELVAFCNRRGASWWRSIPRIGPGRARAIVSWLRRQQAPLGLTVDADVDSVEKEGMPLVAAELVEVVFARGSHQPRSSKGRAAPRRVPRQIKR